MATPIALADQDLIVVQHRWRDTRTGQGVDAKITWTPVAFSGDGTPNLTYSAGKEWFKTRSWTTRPDYTSGYMAVPLPPFNDPDLSGYTGVRVSPEGETAVTVAVPYNAPLVDVTTEMRDALGALDVPFTVGVGQQVRAVWLTELAPAAPPSGGGQGTFWTRQQTIDAIINAVVAHDGDTEAHPDLRALIEQGGIGSSVPSGGAGGVLSGNYPNPGFAVDMTTQAEHNAHVASTTPHPAYDDLPSLTLRFENGLV